MRFSRHARGLTCEMRLTYHSNLILVDKTAAAISTTDSTFRSDVKAVHEGWLRLAYAVRRCSAGVRKTDSHLERSLFHGEQKNRFERLACSFGDSVNEFEVFAVDDFRPCSHSGWQRLHAFFHCTHAAPRGL